MNKETIILKNLSIGYRTKNNLRTVAEDINAAIRQGELTCLLGANGVGKSTLLRTLSAFQPKLGGEIIIRSQESGDRSQESGDRSQEIDAFTDKELSRLIGVVLTEKPDIRNMTVRELVALGRSPYTGFWGTLHEEDWQVVDEAIEAVRIGGLRERMVHTLSDGERQKVMIAKALAQQTPVIFLDEPTAFLDFPSKVEMMQLLRRLAREQQKTIFLSTHDFELALQVADTLWLMESGVRSQDSGDRSQESGVSIGTPRELAQSGALARYVERPGITFEAETLTVRVAQL
jgi:iron complex transport system ATP-binding protein